MKRIFSALLCLLALTAFLIPVYAEDEPAPADEQPVQEQPVEEAPAEEQPVEEQPVEEQPVEEQPAEEQPAEEQPAAEETVQISLDLTDAWAGRAFDLTAPGGVSVQEAVSEEGTVTFGAPGARYYAVFPAGGGSPDPPADIQAAEEEPETAGEEDGDVTILVYLGKNWAGTVFSARTELTDYPEEFSVSSGGVLTLSLEESTDFWAGTELIETAAAAADDTEAASKTSDSDEESSDLMVFLYFGGLAVIAVCYGIYRLRKRAAAGAEDKKKEEEEDDDDDDFDDDDDDEDEYGRFRREDGEDGPWPG